MNTIFSNRDARPNETGSRIPAEIRPKTTKPPKRKAQIDNSILLRIVPPMGSPIATKSDEFCPHNSARIGAVEDVRRGHSPQIRGVIPGASPSPPTARLGGGLKRTQSAMALDVRY